MRGSKFARRWTALVAAAIALSGVLLGSTAIPAQAAGDDVVLTGHGFGHGRGLSQWGAYGYATRFGWSYTQILQRYYSNAGMSNIGNPVVGVRLLALDGAPLAVTPNAPFMVDGRQLAAGTAGVITRNADGTWQLTTRASCSGAVTGSVQISATAFSPVTDPGNDIS